MEAGVEEASAMIRGRPLRQTQQRETRRRVLGKEGNNVDRAGRLFTAVFDTNL